MSKSPRAPGPEATKTEKDLSWEAFTTFLTEKEVAARWQLKPMTIAKQRSERQGRHDRATGFPRVPDFHYYRPTRL